MGYEVTDPNHKSVFDTLKRGDTVKIIDAETNSEIECVVDGISLHNNSITLKHNVEISNIEKLVADNEDIKVLSGVCYESEPYEVEKITNGECIIEKVYEGNIIKIKTKEHIDKFYNSIRNRVAIDMNVLKTDEESVSCKVYCIAFEKINEHLYEYEFKEIK